jgi:hypothetical protein
MAPPSIVLDSHFSLPLLMRGFACHRRHVAMVLPAVAFPHCHRQKCSRPARAYYTQIGAFGDRFDSQI